MRIDNERKFMAHRTLFIKSFEGTHGRAPGADEATEATEYILVHAAAFGTGPREAWLAYHRWKGLPDPDLAVNS